VVPEPFRRRTIIAAGRVLKETVAMRSVLLWLIGVPIPLILLLAFCTHHF
jgi:hypothetical protein